MQLFKVFSFILLCLFASSSFSEGCPSPPIKLKAQPPPILDQGPLPWCSTMATTSSLSYYAQSTGQLPSGHSLSPACTNQIADDDSANKAGTINFGKNSTTNNAMIFQSVAESGFELDTEKKFPTIFSDEEYKKFFDFIIKKDGSMPPSLSSPTHTFSFHNNEDTPFQSSVSVEYREEDPNPSIPDSVKFPPFDVTYTVFTESKSSDKEKYISNLVNSLSSNSMPVIGVCMNALQKKLNFPINISEQSDSCGEHDVAVQEVGQDTNGQCYVKIQNSYGTSWGKGGTFKVAIDDIFEAAKADKKKNILSVTQIKQAEDPNDPTFYFHDSSSNIRHTSKIIDGSFQTIKKELIEGGLVTGNANGNFRNGNLWDGTFKSFPLPNLLHGKHFHSVEGTGQLQAGEGTVSLQTKGKINDHNFKLDVLAHIKDGNVHSYTYPKLTPLDETAVFQGQLVADKNGEFLPAGKGELYWGSHDFEKGQFKEGYLWSGNSEIQVNKESGHTDTLFLHWDNGKVHHVEKRTYQNNSEDPTKTMKSAVIKNPKEWQEELRKYEIPFQHPNLK